VKVSQFVLSIFLLKFVFYHFIFFNNNNNNLILKNVTISTNFPFFWSNSLMTRNSTFKVDKLGR
jgi:hypothetical protein